MLKFIRSVRNKLAESWDVGYGRDRRRLGYYGDRK